MSLLQMHPEGQRDLVFHRHFDAPPERVFSRFTEPGWIRRWLGTEDRPLEDVVFEAQPGGRIRYLWGGPDGALEMTGAVLEIAAPFRIRHTERFAPDWTGGETVVATRFDPEGPGTEMSMRITYADAAARDRAMALPMAEGMERHFDRLDRMLCP
jgi:uncharacterized protein YndB with AHSA1/START domain